MELATLEPATALTTVGLAMQAADTHSRAAQPVASTVLAAASVVAAVDFTAVVVAVDSTAEAGSAAVDTAVVAVDTGNL